MTGSAPTLFVEQPMLFEDIDSAAFLLSSEELAKRYTGAQCKAVESVRELARMALLSGWPINEVARVSGMNHRTLSALAFAEAAKVATDLKTLAQSLLATGAGWYGLARAQQADAPFAQLAQQGSFAISRAIEVLGAVSMMGQGEEGKVLEMENGESEALRSLREHLAALGRADAASGEGHSQHSEEQGVNGECVAGAAGEAPDLVAAAARSGGEGGGSSAGSAETDSIGQLSRGVMAKASPDAQEGSE